MKYCISFTFDTSSAFYQLLKRLEISFGRSYAFEKAHFLIMFESHTPVVRAKKMILATSLYIIIVVFDILCQQVAVLLSGYPNFSDFVSEIPSNLQNLTVMP